MLLQKPPTQKKNECTGVAKAMTKRERQNPEQCVTSHIISQAGKNNSLQSIHTLHLSVAFPLLTRPAFSVCPQKQLYVSCSSWRTNCLQQAGRNVLKYQNSCRQAVSQSRIQCGLIHLIKVEAYLLCDKTVPMWIGHGLPRSSWPALPHHSTPAGDETHVLAQTAALMTSTYPVQEQECSLLIDWNSVMWFMWSHCVYRASAVYEQHTHTHRGDSKQTMRRYLLNLTKNIGL